VDAHTLGEALSSDPLMTLKLMAHAGRNRSSRWITETETVTPTLLMVGISPFFRIFGPQPTIESLLQNKPAALAGLQAVIRRAHRAANFALGFAVHRMDGDAPVIYEAALLHDFVEMLLWCQAPSLAMAIAERQSQDSTLRTAQVQREILNVELTDVQHGLMHEWRLPQLLIDITDDKHTEHPIVKNVMLSIRLARHTANGWDNPAIPDDIKEIAALLNLSSTAALQLVRDIEGNDELNSPVQTPVQLITNLNP
jgi:HD-like signal output (HDOD) protein